MQIDRRTFLVRAAAASALTVSPFIFGQACASSPDATAGLGRLLVISPHLDDAVLSCAHLIAKNPGAVVATVFAGTPSDGSVATSWDKGCGFSSAREAMCARREEDRIALAHLGARPLWLECLDSQYRNGDGAGDVASMLALVLQKYRPTTVAVPLGLGHEDHHLTHFATLSLLAQLSDVRWLLYEEAVHGRTPWIVENRIAAFEQESGARLQPLDSSMGRNHLLKGRAVQSYKSQLRGLGMAAWSPGTGLPEGLRQEHYWTV
ncbi:MAG TPA: PIG-L family deacetylase [Burkholderiales bacterium]|nr:PIG-L family deacetylase [Burkholderiales bacterium]